MNTAEEKPKFELQEKAEKEYKAIQILYRKVNELNKIQRNHPCPCGSGKKWKKCCMKEHELDTLVLERKIKRYRDLCRQLNRRSI